MKGYTFPRVDRSFEQETETSCVLKEKKTIKGRGSVDGSYLRLQRAMNNLFKDEKKPSRKEDSRIEVGELVVPKMDNGDLTNVEPKATFF